MRNMSFALTTEQMKAKTKTVTRRLGWTFLKPGDFINAVEKCQGLKKGEKVKRLGTIVVRSVKRERLNVLLDEIDYGIEEVKREGLEEHPEVMGSPWSFVDFFCRTHAKCNGDTVVTRIEFEHFSL